MICCIYVAHFPLRNSAQQCYAADMALVLVSPKSSVGGHIGSLGLPHWVYICLTIDNKLRLSPQHDSKLSMGHFKNLQVLW